MKRVLNQAEIKMFDLNEDEYIVDLNEPITDLHTNDAIIVSKNSNTDGAIIIPKNHCTTLSEPNIIIKKGNHILKNYTITLANAKQISYFIRLFFDNPTQPLIIDLEKEHTNTEEKHIMHMFLSVVANHPFIYQDLPILASLAIKYLAPHLFDYVDILWAQNRDIKILNKVFQMIGTYGLTSLSLKSKIIMYPHTEYIEDIVQNLDIAAWQLCPFRIVRYIIVSEHIINVCTEETLFILLCIWLTKNINDKYLMLFNHIRYFCMNKFFFNQVVTQMLPNIQIYCMDKITFVTTMLSYFAMPDQFRITKREFYDQHSILFIHRTRNRALLPELYIKNTSEVSVQRYVNKNMSPISYLHKTVYDNSKVPILRYFSGKVTVDKPTFRSISIIGGYKILLQVTMKQKTYVFELKLNHIFDLDNSILLPIDQIIIDRCKKHCVTVPMITELSLHLLNNNNKYWDYISVLNSNFKSGLRRTISKKTNDQELEFCYGIAFLNRELDEKDI